MVSPQHAHNRDPQNETSASVERDSTYYLTRHIADSTAENLDERLTPYITQVARGDTDVTAVLALGVGGCIAGENYLKVQPLIGKVNSVLTARLNILDESSVEWNWLRPLQAEWFGIFKGKLGKEPLVKDGLEGACRQYPDVATEDLADALQVMISTLESTSEEKRIKVLLDLGGLYYAHNKTSNELYQTAMAKVIHYVTTTPLSRRETVAGIISLTHCEFDHTPTAMARIVSGGNPNLPRYMSAWPLAIADNMKIIVESGIFQNIGNLSQIAAAMYDQRISAL